MWQKPMTRLFHIMRAEEGEKRATKKGGKTRASQRVNNRDDSLTHGVRKERGLTAHDSAFFSELIRSI
jgi:hypothetical protein